MSNLQSLFYFWPELILSGTILVAIIVDLIYPRKQSFKVAYWVLGGIIIVGVVIVMPGGDSVFSLFMNTIALDPFAQFFKILILLATGLVILISLKSKELKSYRLGEYFSILAILAFGLFIMVSATDLLMVYLSLEIASIMSYFLAGYLKSAKSSSEASLKYVIYGAFSSGIMLFGLSILFGLTGSTQFGAIRSAIMGLEGSANLALILASVFILVGFGYKISAVPFHFWTPDVYEGSPTAVTAYLSVAPKAAGFALLIRFFNQVFADNISLSALSWSALSGVQWPQLIAVLSVATMTLGNIVAIQQNSVKRMLAYSSIAHAGYMMMGLPVLSSQGIFGIMIYLIMYLFMNLGAFFVVIYVESETGKSDYENFKGLGWKMPFIGVVMTLFMISLTGLPPTAGFIGKFYLFAALIKAGPGFYWLAVIGVLNSVVSLYYYFRVVKSMYLEGKPSKVQSIPSLSISLILLALAIPSLLFGIYWEPIANWVTNSMTLLSQVM
ncbi:MAG: NADH-quinone oxidoreductase subunit N [Fidelibacterota bacterium]